MRLHAHVVNAPARACPQPSHPALLAQHIVEVLLDGPPVAACVCAQHLPAHVRAGEGGTRKGGGRVGAQGGVHAQQELLSTVAKAERMVHLGDQGLCEATHHACHQAPEVNTESPFPVVASYQGEEVPPVCMDGQPLLASRMVPQARQYCLQSHVHDRLIRSLCAWSVSQPYAGCISNAMHAQPCRTAHPAPIPHPPTK